MYIVRSMTPNEFLNSKFKVLLCQSLLSCGESVNYRFIEFFVVDYGSLPYLLSLFFWLGVTFPLVATDKTVVCGSVTSEN